MLFLAIPSCSLTTLVDRRRSFSSRSSNSSPRVRLEAACVLDDDDDDDDDDDEVAVDPLISLRFKKSKIVGPDVPRSAVDIPASVEANETDTRFRCRFFPDRFDEELKT